MCIYLNTNTNISQMTLFLLEKGLVFGKVEVELGLQVKGHTRWFNPWPFHPRTLEVTYPVKKGHIFTIPKRSPAELPGTFFLVNHSMNFKFWGYSIRTFQTSMNMFHLNTLQKELNTCTTKTLVVHDRCWVDVSDKSVSCTSWYRTYPSFELGFYTSQVVIQISSMNSTILIIKLRLGRHTKLAVRFLEFWEPWGP